MERQRDMEAPLTKVKVGGSRKAMESTHAFVLVVHANVQWKSDFCDSIACLLSTFRWSAFSYWAKTLPGTYF